MLHVYYLGSVDFVFNTACAYIVKSVINKYMINKIMAKQKPKQAGFTIIELLVVIVILGILFAIGIVSYDGMIERANIASLQEDLDTASKQIKVYKIDNYAYPGSINDCPTPSAGNICVETSSDNTLSYSANNSADTKSFRLTASNDGVSYSNNKDDIKCPQNFIVVPGSATYGTRDFCVMKYEAKKVGMTNIPISKAKGLPWVNISQTDAITTSAAACTGCHLITEAEWLTVAQNVLGVGTNWSSGTVGSGYIYSGHNDGTPGSALEASADDNSGYYLTQNGTSGTQHRTLTLTNGEVIWDMAGNIWEWTSGQTTGGQPGSAGYNYRQWSTIINPGTISPNPSPVITGISGSGVWDSSNGIGQIYSNADETNLRAFMRGGSWSDDDCAGILTLYLDNEPGSIVVDVGFRVAR